MDYFAVGTETKLALSFILTETGQPLTGLSPNVTFRSNTNTNSFLDFNDLTFKTQGWTQREKDLSETDSGVYQYILDLALLNLSNGDSFTAVYTATYNTQTVKKYEVFNIVSLSNRFEQDLSLVRKSITNRMEETPGNPGNLRLFDDDGLTVLYTWELRDAANGATVALSGAPSKRSAGR